LKRNPVRFSNEILLHLRKPKLIAIFGAGFIPV